MFKIYTKCHRCNGSGVYSATIHVNGVPQEIDEDPCSRCQGEKYEESNMLLDGALTEKLNEIKTKINQVQADTNKIWEKVKDL